MRLRSVLTTALVVLAAVAGGTLECSRKRAGTPEVQQGRKVYVRMCAVCHGENGEGYKADQATALRHPDFLASVTDEFLRQAITNGRTSTTMSAWGVERGGPLAKADVNAVIAFVRTWSSGPKAALDERPLTTGAAGAGQTSYARVCARCHGERGVGGQNVAIGNPQLLASASNGYLRYAIGHGRSGTAMEGFAATLGDSNIEDILALMRSWQAGSAPPPAFVGKPPPIPLGRVPLHPKGPEPLGFNVHPKMTSADVIKAQLDRGARMVVLDARAPSDYMNEHITGAVSVPFYEPEPYFAGLPKSSWLVCYCGCPHAESGQLAQKLLANGFTKVTVLDEGLGFWKTKKYGTHTGVTAD